MPTNTSVKKYTGKYRPLSKPIVLPATNLQPLSLISTDEQKKIFEKKKQELANKYAFMAMGESFKKMDLLFDYFNLDSKKDGWPMLAFCLAKEHIPGFFVKHQKPSGAPKQWNGAKQLALFWEINDLLDSKKRSNKAFKVSDACALLAKERGVSAKTLQNQYSKAKNSELLKLYKKLTEHIHKSEMQNIRNLFLSM